MITWIRNALKNKEISVESFLELCVTREQKVVFQSFLLGSSRKVILDLVEKYYNL